MKYSTVLLTTSLPAIFVFAPLAAAQPQSLTVAWYGGNWGDAFQSCVATPFTEATGIAVVPDIGTSTTTLSKLQQQAGAPVIDVAYMDGGISELAEEAGVLADIDIESIPNAANLADAATYRNGDKVYAVGNGYYSLGMTYNTDEISEAPASWDALWDEHYAGAVTIPSPSNSAGIPFIFFLNQIMGDTPDDMSATIERLRELDAALFFDSSGAASNAFQSGEVILGAHFNVGAWALIDSGLPIGFTVPEEGVWATDARLHIVEGTQNGDAALQFIDTALGAEAGLCLAERLYVGPAVTNVDLTEEVSRKLPWGETGSIDDLMLFDWNEVNARRSDLTETWNREVVR
ncbi:ABC transporter substrate-binding protein [Billgrantia endophytica]|uniref:Polyamine ABC transporter substrate-binding protein n=1 Tax=Billgrantia endophytica TaxID=2033802 RepID=A0A2N7U7Z5_9GAMM|nr:ABC transporter substrate-binding protein [Halomonas endophytica]PMR76546.1 polyamine ABC transporter substrate-binding protein [Halomonas endophytica]